MPRTSDPRSKTRPLEDWFSRKPSATRAIFDHFVTEYKRLGDITVRPAKTMIVVTTPRKGIAYIVPRKDVIDVVMPFKQAYPDNLCFHKIAQVPGGPPQFNHHLRLVDKKDINKEVRRFMLLAYELGC